METPKPFEYLSIAQTTPEVVFSYIGMGIVSWNGYDVDMGSQRYKVFRDDTTCVGCGLIGTHMVLQQKLKLNPDENNTRAHFNLYAIKDGEWILFTKDHIFPKSKGGGNTLQNYVTMCYDCNQLKADQLPMESM